MQVAHVITRLIVGGAQENTISTVLGLLQKSDCNVSLLSGPTFGAEGSLEPLVKRVPGLVTIIPSLVRPVKPDSDWKALGQLRKHFAATRPDIVHTHSGKAGILGRIAAHQAGVPIIIHTVHGPSFGSFQGGFANVVFRSAERFAAKYTTHFITVANAMTEQYLAAGIGHREQYTRIFSGFNITPFLQATNDLALRKKLGIAPDDIVIGKIGRLFELKGHDDLFAIAPELVKRCPRIKFLLVGDGPWRSRFEELAKSTGLIDRFIFTGLVPPTEVSNYVGIMDMLVHLSRREGLPRALPQALAAARPIVAYDCDGAREVCLENETGFLIPSGNLELLSNRIIELANKPELRAQFGSHGQKMVRELFPVERMVDEIYALYLRLGANLKSNGVSA